MVEDKLLEDLTLHMGRMDDLLNFLDKLYYHPDFSNLFNQPAIGFMSTGAKFLRTNLELFRNKRIDQLG